MPVTHTFVSEKPPASDSTQVGSTEWNAAHTVSIANADVDPAAGIAESKLSLNYPTHAELTIGTANGLSLAGQALSLGLASSGVTGALSGADWDTFNGKQALLTFPLAANLGGTGVDNGANTLTVPATGTAALLATANVFTVGQMIDGTSNQIQFRTQGHSTQTAALQTWETSAGAVLGQFDSTGIVLNSGKVFTFYDTSNTHTATIGSDSDQSGASTTQLIMRATVANQGIGFSLLPASGGTQAQIFVYGAFTDISNLKYLQITVPKTSAVQFSQTAAGSGFSVGNFEFNLTHAAYLHEIHATTTNNKAWNDNLRLETRLSTGTVVAGFGSRLSWYAETATNATNQPQAAIESSWIDATNASRKAKLSIRAYDTAERVGIEIEASGTAIKLGFFGGTTAVQQTLNSYTSDGEGSAYTGIDNAQAGTVYATVADLNQLRTAYETLRASYDDLRTKLQTSTIVA